MFESSNPQLFLAKSYYLRKTDYKFSVHQVHTLILQVRKETVYNQPRKMHLNAQFLMQSFLNEGKTPEPHTIVPSFLFYPNSPSRAV